jgi:hypothetical protein
MFVVSDDLLKLYKQSIGDLNANGNPLDDYYKGFLIAALSDLGSDDISEVQLNSQLGKFTTCLIAEALMNKTDIANNSTITLLKNKLSILTKGDRVENV